MRVAKPLLMKNEWTIILMLNALEDTNYEPLCIQLLSCFQDDLYTSTKKNVYNTIAFAGYKHKQESMEQANVTKSQRESPKGKTTCLNPNCKAYRHYATKDCWYEGGGTVHKAPEWWKELQAKRKKKHEDTT